MCQARPSASVHSSARMICKNTNKNLVFSNNKHVYLYLILDPDDSFSTRELRGRVFRNKNYMPYKS